MQVASETPDIVSSCDSGEGSKRNSLELDTESLGILRLAKKITTIQIHKKYPHQPRRDGGQHDPVDGLGEQLGQGLLVGTASH